MDEKQQKQLNKQLRKAILKKDSDGVKVALGSGADPNCTARNGMKLIGRSISYLANDIANPIIAIALQYGTSDILDKLLKSGANCNAMFSCHGAGIYGMAGNTTPLLYAIHKDKTDFVRILLDDKTTNPYDTGSHKVLTLALCGLGDGGKYSTSTPLEYAKKKGNSEIIKMLEDHIAQYEEIKKQEKIEDDHRSLKAKRAIDELHKAAEELGVRIDYINVSVNDNKQDEPKLDVKKFATLFKPHRP